MAKLTISQKSGLGTVKEIISEMRNILKGEIDDIRVTKAGTVIVHSNRLVDLLPEKMKWRTKGIKYDPSNGRYWLPKKTVKKVCTLPRWEKV